MTDHSKMSAEEAAKEIEKFFWAAEITPGVCYCNPEKVLEIIQAQRQAAVEEYKANLWQPIDTAPKDGTWVLTWGPGFKRPRMCYWGEGARMESAWRSSYNETYGGQTHWMPLPEAPKGEQAE